MAVAKRMKTWKDKIVPGKQYPVEEALKLVKELATAKFAEAVDAAVNLGIDASKSDQQDGAPIAQRNVRRSNSPRRSVWSALNRREIGRRRGIRCGTRYGGWCQPRMLPEWPHPK